MRNDHARAAPAAIEPVGGNDGVLTDDLEKVRGIGVRRPVPVDLVEAAFLALAVLPTLPKGTSLSCVQ